MPNPAENNIGWMLIRAANSWRAAANLFMSDLGITQPRWTALLYLQRLGEGCSQRELADAIGIEQPSILRTLNGLEESGLIERRPCPKDARRRTIWFTNKGWDLLIQVEKHAQEGRQTLLENFNDTEKAQLLDLLQRTLDNAQDYIHNHQPTPPASE